MNFQTIASISPGSTYLHLAFRQARVKAAQKKRKGTRQQVLQRKETTKLDIITSSLTVSFQRILHDFPKEQELSPFYTQLVHLTLDYPHYKKSLGAVHWASGKVRELQRIYVSKIHKTGNFHSFHSQRQLSAQFYGRVSSVIKQINQELLYLEQARQIMKTYPDIKEMPTICIYGFPNVGKTTLLNALTGTKAKVADYAFTTTSINAGYCTINEKRVQVLDVPGSLARVDKMNLIEQQAELVLQSLADVVIFVFDVSGQYPFSVQQQLLAKVQEKMALRQEKKKVLVYLSRQQVYRGHQQNDEQFPWPALSIISMPVTTSLPQLREELAQFLLPPPEH
ncbi:MAG: GTPase [Nanoarchaeota archaeon]